MMRPSAPFSSPARTAMGNEGGRRAQHRCKIMALQLAMLSYSHGAAASLGRHRTLAFATAPRLLPSRLRRPAASACRQEAAAASSARMGADRDEDVFQYLMHGGVRGTSTLQRGNAGAAATALQCAAPTRADGDITGTILRLDTELTGAWSEEGTAGAGQRSKAWFKQQEEERVRILGCKERGLPRDGPMNHTSGKGWVAAKKGDYHDALVNKRSRVIPAIIESAGGLSACRRRSAPRCAASRGARRAPALRTAHQVRK